MRRELALAAVLAMVGCSGGGDGGPAPSAAAVDPAVAAGRHFLDTYVEDDGRVVRHDQGGDTVSEGQAYAMLVSQAVGDRERFEAAWSWASSNLLREDGLLAWQWSDGEVVDPMPATDADLDAAWSLLLAAERFGEPGYRDDALALAEAVLERETVEVDGDLVLVAGPWATEVPHVVNPSYVSPPAFDLLAEATGDPAWAELADASRQDLEALLTTPSILPPDWAVVEGDGDFQPAAPPGRDGDPVRYGLDAGRLFVRLAASCDRSWSALAAPGWEVLQRSEATGAAIAYDLGGGDATEGEHPAMAVAAAGAASAAGDRGAREALLTRAERLDAESPTYYGAAWVALGRLLLPSCDPDPVQE